MRSEGMYGKFVLNFHCLFPFFLYFSNDFYLQIKSKQLQEMIEMRKRTCIAHWNFLLIKVKNLVYKIEYLL